MFVHVTVIAGAHVHSLLTNPPHLYNLFAFTLVANTGTEKVMGCKNGTNLFRRLYLLRYNK